MGGVDLRIDDTLFGIICAQRVFDICSILLPSFKQPVSCLPHVSWVSSKPRKVSLHST